MRKSEQVRAARRGFRATIVRRWALVVGLVGLLPGSAQGNEGAALFKTLCASCHGIDGRGDGPAAEAMQPRPTDLTTSTLNLAELMRVIDGRRTVRAHGDGSMPVWGREFKEAMAGSGRENRDSLRQVQMLAEYVRSLEKSPTK
jgi:mono/diheme cytochrome c family protein